MQDAFPKSYYIVNPHHLSFGDDMENFEKYTWGTDVYEEI